MKAHVWHGRKDIRHDTVPDPSIEGPRDAIVKVTSCAICGSDLHLLDGLAAKAFGHACAGLFGYTHLTGGYAGGQAEYVRVPFADAAREGCTMTATARGCPSASRPRAASPGRISRCRGTWARPRCGRCTERAFRPRGAA